jgi:hypothetical protein
MKSILLPFHHRETSYVATIIPTETGDCIEYRISLNEKTLQGLLLKDDAIKEVNGILELTVAKTYKEETELLISISIALSNYLHLSCFVNGQCPLVTNTTATSNNFTYSKPKTQNHLHLSFFKKRHFVS